MNHISFFKKSFSQIELHPVSILYAYFLSADFQLEGCIFIAIVMPHNLKNKQQKAKLTTGTKNPKNSPLNSVNCNKRDDWAATSWSASMHEWGSFLGHGQMWLLSPLFFSTCLASGCHQTGHRRGQGKKGPFQSSEGITSKVTGSCKPWWREHEMLQPRMTLGIMCRINVTFKNSQLSSFEMVQKKLKISDQKSCFLIAGL